MYRLSVNHIFMNNQKEELRANNSRDTRLLNKIGERLYWIRTTLGISQNEVAKIAGIPLSSYNGRENGVRSINYEEFIVLENYFNDKWQNKFKKEFPEYSGRRIDRITHSFIIYGYYA